MIICAPIFDFVTEITYDESREAKKYAEYHGVATIDLSDELAIKANVEAELRINLTALFFHADHGNPDMIWGDDEKPVIDMNNVQLLADRENYMVNCSSAKTLGVEAFKKGALAFWGYTDIVSLTTDALPEFEEFFLYGLKRRIDGQDWPECLEGAITKANELIDKLVNEGKTLAATCMLQDRDILVCYTPENPPISSCPFRRLAIFLFGEEIGWKL